MVVLNILINDWDDYFRENVKNCRQNKQIFEREKFDHVNHLIAKSGRLNRENYFKKFWQTNVWGIK
jgi:hypothetical protein